MNYSPLSVHAPRRTRQLRSPLTRGAMRTAPLSRVGTAATAAVARQSGGALLSTAIGQAVRRAFPAAAVAAVAAGLADMLAEATADYFGYDPQVVPPGPNTPPSFAGLTYRGVFAPPAFNPDAPPPPTVNYLWKVTDWVYKQYPSSINPPTSGSSAVGYYLFNVFGGMEMPPAGTRRPWALKNPAEGGPALPLAINPGQDLWLYGLMNGEGETHPGKTDTHSAQVHRWFNPGTSPVPVELIPPAPVLEPAWVEPLGVPLPAGLPRGFPLWTPAPQVTPAWRPRPRVRPEELVRPNPHVDTTIDLRPTSVVVSRLSPARPPRSVRRERKFAPLGKAGRIAAGVAFFLWEAVDDWTDWLDILINAIPGVPEHIRNGRPQTQLDWLRENVDQIGNADWLQIMVELLGWGADEAFGAFLGDIQTRASQSLGRDIYIGVGVDQHWSPAGPSVGQLLTDAIYGYLYG